MIIACINCNGLAFLFLPLALWVFKKFRKNHKCPCDCHIKYEELGKCAVEQTKITPQDSEEEIHKKINRCFREAQENVLKNGESVLIVEGNNLVKLNPDRSKEILRPIGHQENFKTPKL